MRVVFSFTFFFLKLLFDANIYQYIMQIHSLNRIQCEPAFLPAQFFFMIQCCFIPSLVLKIDCKQEFLLTLVASGFNTDIFMSIPRRQVISISTARCSFLIYPRTSSLSSGWVKLTWALLKQSPVNCVCLFVSGDT